MPSTDATDIQDQHVLGVRLMIVNSGGSSTFNKLQNPEFSSLIFTITIMPFVWMAGVGLGVGEYFCNQINQVLIT